MEEKVKVGMATVEARMDDAGFIYSAWSGLRKVRENFRIKASIVESKGDEDLRAHLDFLSNEGYKIVWAVGYNAETPLMEAAARYPHIHFLGLDVHYEQIPQNVTTVEFREQEGAFLAGYTATAMPKVPHMQQSRQRWRRDSPTPSSVSAAGESSQKSSSLRGATSSSTPPAP